MSLCLSLSFFLCACVCISVFVSLCLSQSRSVCLSSSAICARASISTSMMHIVYASSTNAKFINFPICFLLTFCFIYVCFASPIMWQRCIYASCLTRSGRPCRLHVRVPSTWQYIMSLLEVTYRPFLLRDQTKSILFSDLLDQCLALLKLLPDYLIANPVSSARSAPTESAKGC